ncbi:MAG: DUF1211 domain-containing protein [Methanobrevibacter sp.]|uniref:TMEM175 family protein n=1 Tax=Methanobrevibacter sp. TaxID=66852 RepID=UPI0025F34C63|nr:TMEM175 family protein [Methanobrevibacter sp.]MBR0272033.1 DUF1211 domain-containing protein [Methanobrevibacter sp.]
MTQEDLEKYEELIDLKNQIDSQIEDIKSSADEETVEKMERLYAYLKSRGKLKPEDDIDERIQQLNNVNRRLSYYQRFLNAFERDVDIDPGRLLGLTDGIFGMVMTLLIFGMALPEIQLLTEGDFLAFIQSLAPTVGVTLVSFILLACFWIYHHEFIKVKTLNIPYLWLNVFFLACISFIPFTTSIIGAYSKFFLAEVIFGLNIFLTLVFFMLMFWYANHRNFLERKISISEKKYTYTTFFIIMGLTMLVNILDFRVSSNFIYLFFLVPVISTIRDIRFKMKT